jgi:hypothetical protein
MSFSFGPFLAPQRQVFGFLTGWVSRHHERPSSGSLHVPACGFASAPFRPPGHPDALGIGYLNFNDQSSERTLTSSSMQLPGVPSRPAVERPASTIMGSYRMRRCGRQGSATPASGRP